MQVDHAFYARSQNYKVMDMSQTLLLLVSTLATGFVSRVFGTV